MRSPFRQSALLAALFCLQFCVGSNTQAQELRKQIGERHGKPIVNYRPDDPWTRGKVFNLQAGYSGLFFNCDNEECKRNSPYICWKPDNEKMFPTPLGLWGHAKQTCSEVKQRIRDGAGACARDCNCSKCQSRHHAAVPTRRYVEQKPTPKFGSNFVAKRPESGNRIPNQSTGEKIAAPRFGLISGKIRNATAPATIETEEVVSPPSPLRYAAGQNGFDQHLRTGKKR